MFRPVIRPKGKFFSLMNFSHVWWSSCTVNLCLLLVGDCGRSSQCWNGWPLSCLWFTSMISLLSTRLGVWQYCCIRSATSSLSPTFRRLWLNARSVSLAYFTHVCCLALEVSVFLAKQKQEVERVTIAFEIGSIGSAVQCRTPHGITIACIEMPEHLCQLMLSADY